MVLSCSREKNTSPNVRSVANSAEGKNCSYGCRIWLISKGNLKFSISFHYSIPPTLSSEFFSPGTFTEWNQFYLSYLPLTSLPWFSIAAWGSPMNWKSSAIPHPVGARNWLRQRMNLTAVRKLTPTFISKIKLAILRVDQLSKVVRALMRTPNQSTNQPTNQPINQSINKWVSEWMNEWLTFSNWENSQQHT